jgi:hypothetical protein
MIQFTCKGVKQINNRISLNRISRLFSSAREFQMGNFQKYWSQNVGQDFIFTGGRFWKLTGGTEGALKIGRNFFCWGGRSCGRLMSPAQETQSMREIRLLHGRLLCKGGGLTGMVCFLHFFLSKNLKKRFSDQFFVVPEAESVYFMTSLTISD